jgi:hypothetical protein
MSEPNDKAETPEEHSRRVTVNLVAAIVCLVILILGIWLINSLSASMKLQECLLAGRRNCAPPIAVDHGG